MKYFHCPKKFRMKDYGCGFGPVNSTEAIFDLHPPMICPDCGKDLKEYRNPPGKKMVVLQKKLQSAEMAEELGRRAGRRGAGLEYLSTHSRHRSK